MQDFLFSHNSETAVWYPPATVSFIHPIKGILADCQVIPMEVPFTRSSVLCPNETLRIYNMPRDIALEYASHQMSGIRFSMS